MIDQLQQKTDLFIRNIQSVKDNFKWDSSLLRQMVAFMYTTEDREVDVIGIRKAKDIIKSNTGLFSMFKDSTFLALAAMVAMNDNPEEYFKNTMNVYNRMKKAGFSGSNYLAISALIIAKKTEEYNYDNMIDNTKNYYNRMKKEHIFLTSYDDYCFATMLGISELGIDYAIREMEECYKILKGHFFSGNGVQSLSHILAFGEEDATIKCERVLKIAEMLKRKKCKIGYDGELTSLGILALITDDIDKITDDIAKVSGYFHDMKAFGTFFESSMGRNRYAAALVSSTHVQNLKDDILNITLQNSLTNILIAQETAVILAVTASAAASASN